MRTTKFQPGTGAVSPSVTEPLSPDWSQSLASISCVKAAFDTDLWDDLLGAEAGGFALEDRSFSMAFWRTLQELGLGRIEGVQFLPDRHAIERLATPENKSKVVFQAMAAADMLEHGAFFLSKQGDIPEASRVFGFFNYADAESSSPRRRERVQAWIRYLAYCSRRENHALLPEVKLPTSARVLEIGGNVGLFSAGLLAQNPTACAVVFDLPGVVAHVPDFLPPEAMSDRLIFHSGDIRFDPLPLVRDEAPNVIVFKSMLHDWPDELAQAFLLEALEHLAKDGALVIVERQASSFDELPLSIANAHNTAFTRFYRQPDWYVEAASGMAQVGRVVQVNIDTGFFILTLNKTQEGNGA